MMNYKDRAQFAHEMLHRYIEKAPNNVVSDIGAGYGHMQHKIESLGCVWQPFDYYKKMDYTLVWDLNYPCPPNTSKAGLVVFLEVLEHLDNPLLSLNHISNHMEKDSILILTTPNPQSSKNRLNLLLKGTLYAFQEKHLKENHVFTPWEHIVSHFLVKSGFKIVEYATIDTAYIKVRPTSLKGFIKYLLERIIEKMNPKSKGMSYGLVAIKV